MTEVFLAEVLGTMTLILLGDGVVAGVLLNKTKAQNSGWIVITMAWAFAVFMGVVVAGPYSGAHLNPAVTLGVFLNSGTTPHGDTVDIAMMIVYWAGEFVGAMLGALLVFLHYYPHWSETEDKGLKLAVYCTAPAIRNPVWNLVSETIGTFVLMFGIFCFGAGTPAGLGPLPVALLILVIGLALGPTTGYAINPARDLGPRIMHFILPIPGKGNSDWEYSWIPVVGPMIGAALGWVVYKYLVVEIVAKAIAK